MHILKKKKTTCNVYTFPFQTRDDVIIFNDPSVYGC